MAGARDEGRLFDEQKERYLAALERPGPDRSKKGDVDEAIKPLLAALNALPDYYTTSSCAGRIDLFAEPASGKKHEGEWLLVSHEPVEPAAVRQALAKLATLPPDATLWFRMEGAILHVCCRTLDAADALLKRCKEAGWKHSGVTGTSPRIMVEATTSERIDVPIGKGGSQKEGSLFVPEQFIDFLVQEANRKLKRTREKMARLEESFS